MVLRATGTSTPSATAPGADANPVSGAGPASPANHVDHGDARAPAPNQEGRLRRGLRYTWGNRRLMSGLLILLGLVLFWQIGIRVVDTTKARQGEAAAGKGAPQ